MDDEARRPEEVAEQVAAEAPDHGWLREVIAELERRLHRSEIEWIRTVWGLGAEELATAFGVTETVLEEWSRSGIADEHLDNLAELVAATERLLAYVRPNRIPKLVRREAVALGGHSLVEMVTAGRLRDVRAAVEQMLDLRSSQP